MLGTQGWQKILHEPVSETNEAKETQESAGCENPLNAIDRLVEHLRVPLEGAARCLRSMVSLRKWFRMLLSSSLCLPWSISQCGGSYFMHQILLSGQMF